jgi:MFS family permease
MVSSLLAFPLYELAVFAPSPAVTMALVFAVSLVGGSAFGPSVAAILSVVPPENRATGASIYGFAASLIGIGAAPFIVGVLSDLMSPSFGGAVALQYALAFTIPCGLLGAFCIWRASQTFKAAVEANR